MQKVAHTESARKHTWFRFYNEALDDPKVQRLPAHLFKTWVNLLCLASSHGGDLPSIDDIAFRLRMSVQDAESHLSDLILAGLIDITENGRSPHNWSQRQFASDTSAERTRKYRENRKKRTCDVTCDADVTPQIQSRADTEQNRSDQTNRAAAREPDRPTEPDQNFSDCKQAFNGTTEAMLSEVMAAMQPYGDRKGAASWLATTMRTNGADATAQAFQMLATAKAEGQPIARVLPWWAKTAASLKAKPPSPGQADQPTHWRDARNERARKICQMAMEASHG